MKTLALVLFICTLYLTLTCVHSCLSQILGLAFI